MDCVNQSNFLFEAACQASNNISLLIGLVVGVIISWIFFYIQNKMQKDISYLTELYVVRTCMFNLFDVFSGKDHKIKPTEENRQRFVKKLEEDYIKKFGIRKSEVIEIFKLAKNHEIPNTDHQKDCPECKDLADKIQKFLDDNPNPLQ